MTDETSPVQENKIKAHFARNKQRYILAGAVVGTAVVTALVTKHLVADQSVETSVRQLNLFSDPVTNITNEIIQANGHPGYKIRCLETNHDFASIREAARMMNISQSTLRRHLNGEIPDVAGHTFANMGANLNGLS